MKLLPIVLVFLLCNLNAYSQNASEEKMSDGNLAKYKSLNMNPMDMRDPFKKIASKKKGKIQKDRANGIYSNQNDRIEDKAIENIRIIGVMIGKERRAVAKVFKGNTLGNESYFIKEGMKIGDNGAEVKAILPGGIVLVEKIKNIYDQVEYLETVIPLSND